MKIKLFNEFVNEELTKFINTYTKSGNPRYVDWIHDEPISPKSNSARILLKKQLMDQEIQNMLDNLPSNKEEMDKFNVPKMFKQGIKVLSNVEFLLFKKNQGELRCEYCRKGPLFIYGRGDLESLKHILIKKGFNIFKKFNLSGVRGGYGKKGNRAATVDHKQPISKGGKIFDYNNLAVCCKECNERKRDMSYEEWMKLIDNTNIPKINITKDSL